MLVFVSTITIQAQKVTFLSKHIETAVSKLLLRSQLDTMKAGTHFVNYQGRRVEIRMNQDSQVEHIGIPLFGADIRGLQPLPIYDYLEFALLDHLYKISDNPLDNVNLQFMLGAWSQMATLSDSSECSISNKDDKYYMVSWSVKGKEFVRVIFPISYDMLANSNRREMENIFIRDLRNYVGKRNSTKSKSNEKEMERTNDNLYVKKGSGYIMDGINSNLYFHKVKGDSMAYVCDDKYPDESIANLLIADDASIPDSYITLKFIKYDYKTDSIALPVKTFVSYCRSKGCNVFYGAEEKSKDGSFNGSLFFYNKASGYDHVVSINAPAHGIGKDDYMMKGKVYLFAPTNNVKDLFYKPKVNKKKNIKFD